MDDLVSIAIAEQALDLLGLSAAEPGQVGRAVGGDTARDLGGGRIQHLHRIAAIEAARDRDKSHRQQAAAAQQRGRRAVVNAEAATRGDTGDVALARSQTLERYIEKGKTWVDSLTNQAATQLVLINKLQTDTKQRVVLYDALTKSLKTAQQQDVAHRINEIGVKTDQEAQAAMAAIASATNDRMADMLESHEDHMVFARKVLEQKAKADERFARRFAAIVEKHDKNRYGAE